MAIYHADLKVFSRRLGHSAVAAAAYRIGGTLLDERTGVTHDYSVRAGVAFCQTLLPAGAPRSFRDEAVLWNAAEAAEKRVDARIARELIVALPMELNESERQTLSVALGQMLVDRYGVALTLAVHRPDAMGDDRNHHVHLLFSTRMLDAGGFSGKTRALDDKLTGPDEVKAIREAVAHLTNEALHRAGHDARVDHRSLDAQAEEAANRGDVDSVFRLSRVPTKHEGKAATAGKRRGQRMDRVVANDERRRIGAAKHAGPAPIQALPPSTALWSEPYVWDAPSASGPGRRRNGSVASLLLTRRVRTLRTPLAQRLPTRRADPTSASVYLDALREAERSSGDIARAYIARLRLAGEEAALVLHRALNNAEFALLLCRAQSAHAQGLAFEASRGSRTRASVIGARRKYGGVRNPERRAAAWERRRRQVMPLQSDSRRSDQAWEQRFTPTGQRTTILPRAHRPKL